MIVFLTSSPTGPLDRSRIVEGFDTKNKLVENLKERWAENARCLLISAAPAEAAMADGMRAHMVEAMGISGLSACACDIWDDRTEDFSAEVLKSYDVVFLGGGHVPTQNAFFQRIGLREKMAQFDGLVIGISAGTMNCASTVYAHPELDGEAVDPDYQRFIPGLGLCEHQILPHFQYIRTLTLDGMKAIDEIAAADSRGRCFLCLNDGAYALQKDGKTTVYGEAYLLQDEKLTQICSNNESVEL